MGELPNRNETAVFVDKHYDAMIKWILKDCKCYPIED